MMRRTDYNKLLIVGLGFLILISCKANVSDRSTLNVKANQFYLNAQLKMLEKEYDQAIVLLRKSLESGLPRPMQIVTDSNFYALIDHPGFRPEIRSLLEDFAVENQAVMIRKNQQGEPITVKGQVIDESTGDPLKKAKIELVHTDHEGFYFREHTEWNPGLFAYLITDDQGEFEIQTISPGKYKDDDGSYIPAHIHFTLKKDSFRIYASEFTFEDDSVFLTQENIEQIPVAKRIFPDELKKYLVIIPMQRE